MNHTESDYINEGARYERATNPDTARVIAYKQEILAEREACAKVCDDMESVSPEDDNPAPWRIAEAIRARGETK